ncbi:MAG: DUF899 domain-containing protein, partial [Pseudomonadales bacterium]|nr:DUF899 domain-containing protein [Pseudomonadales bacterium]
MESPTVVSADVWRKARLALLAKEKAHSRQRDALNRERQALPWVKVDKPYSFAAAAGPLTLAELFAGQSQLIIQHFMFDPEWDAGCKSCSFMADHIDPSLVHLRQRDAAFAAVSRAPLEKLLAYKARMGWAFNWVSSYGSDFNRDFDVTFSEE